MKALLLFDDVCPCRVGARGSLARLCPTRLTERKGGTGSEDHCQEQEDFSGSTGGPAQGRVPVNIGDGLLPIGEALHRGSTFQVAGEGINHVLKPRFSTHGCQHMVETAATLVKCHQIRNRLPTVSWRAAAKRPSPICPVSSQSHSLRFDSLICFDGRPNACARRRQRSPGSKEPVGGRSGRLSAASRRKVPSIGLVRPPRSADRGRRKWSGRRRNDEPRSLLKDVIGNTCALSGGNFRRRTSEGSDQSPPYWCSAPSKKSIHAIGAVVHVVRDSLVRAPQKTHSPLTTTVTRGSL